MVIGAGAVGCSIGGKLHESGHEVVLVARGAQATALRADGLRLITPQGTLHLDIPVATGPDEVDLRPDDVLVLTTKTQDSAAALRAWSPRPVAGATAGQVLPVVTAQNGVANERMALRHFRQVQAVCLMLPATYLTPGEVIATAAPYTGMLTIGRYPHGHDDTTEAIAADLEKANLPAPVVPRVMRWKYAKLLANLANAIDAVTGGPVPALRDLAVAEGREVLAVAGIDCATEEEFVQLRGGMVVSQDMPGAGGSSSWQSVVRGTGVETDYLNGEIVALGRLHGIETPVNEALLVAVHESVRTGRSPGGLTAAELAARIGR